jgi:AcrR family transcriptional regulator
MKPAKAESSVQEASAKKAYRRLAPADRRRQIIEAAVSYFAEVGFDGATRALAERLGVTQPLIYRYFPSKEELIRAVYEEVYTGRWRDEWLQLLGQRDVPLRERLIAFYTRYTDVIFQPEWMRIYLFSGLRGLEINRWWITFLEDHVLNRVCAEIRHDLGLPSPDTRPITPEEIELYWLFHGGIFYYGMRRDVYDVAPRLDLKPFIQAAVDSFLDGFPATISAVLAADAPPAA